MNSKVVKIGIKLMHKPMNANKSLYIKELRAKILKGIELATERLIQAKEKEDGELVYSKDGKIIKVKAREMMK